METRSLGETATHLQAQLLRDKKVSSWCSFLSQCVLVRDSWAFGNSLGCFPLVSRERRRMSHKESERGILPSKMQVNVPPMHIMMGVIVNLKSFDYETTAGTNREA